MRLFGWSLTREKAMPAAASHVDSRGGGWFGPIREPFTGAWQRNIETKLDSVLAFSAVYACITLIASDVSKLRIKLVEMKDGVWVETAVPAFSPVLRKPNGYQTRIQFVSQWITSKLIHGNAYILKVRDARGVVTEMHVLDPNRVKVLVAPDGAVYYQLSRDDLSGVGDVETTVPAREIIHDRMNTIFHPLVGVSPIFACGLSATQGLRIQKNSAQFFANGSHPGGILTAPGKVDPENAKRLQEHWERRYSGENVGRIAVLGDGLKYERMAITPVDAQLIEQLRWSGENVCTCFHVPAYMVGIGPAPTYNNIQALSSQYYAQCLQVLIEAMELCLDEGLGLTTIEGKTYGTELDIDGLLRMDTATQYRALADATGGPFMAPNEARLKLDLPKIEGGNTVYMQQQQYSLAALARRDEGNPLGVAEPPPPSPAIDDGAAAQREALAEIRKGLA